VVQDAINSSIDYEPRMEIIDWILHLDEHLAAFAVQLGPWFYALLFAIIFGETGLVIAPFLPGDSLLFALGALAASQPDSLSIAVLVPLLTVAAIVGDAVNYAIGKWVGPQIFRKDTGWVMNKNHLLRAQAFYVKHGAKAIVLARFLPILRTFAPFVAGIGGMQYRRFWLYNVLGGVLWVSLFLIGGYAFGTRPLVKDNFHIVILAIIVISALPIAYEWLKAFREGKAAKL
jgi:membrane-associated protein